jgi:tRNA (cytidine/uridine-2'-O-)-methyltransferase
MATGNPVRAPLLEIVLYEPEIPPNTGNIIRLCANTGCRLHLVRPLGFSLQDRQLRRAGLDYDELVEVVAHPDWITCRESFAGRRLFAVTTRAALRHDQADFREGDALVFGSETRGLPETVLREFDPGKRLRIPMRTAARSLNLSNAVAIIVYEAWRQLGFQRGN